MRTHPVEGDRTEVKRIDEKEREGERENQRGKGEVRETDMEERAEKPRRGWRRADAMYGGIESGGKWEKGGVQG